MGGCWWRVGGCWWEAGGCLRISYWWEVGFFLLAIFVVVFKRWVVVFVVVGRFVFDVVVGVDGNIGVVVGWLVGLLDSWWDCWMVGGYVGWLVGMLDGWCGC